MPTEEVDGTVWVRWETAKGLISCGRAEVVDLPALLGFYWKLTGNDGDDLGF